MKRIADLRHAHGSLIFFESPHRIEKLLAALLEGLGNRRTVLARELTKKFEEFQRGTLKELLERVRNLPPKGEITVVVEGTPRRPPVADEDDAEADREEDTMVEKRTGGDL